MARLTRILTLALGAAPKLLDPDSLPSRTCRARDADSRSAGDLARLTLNTGLATIHPYNDPDQAGALGFRLVPMGRTSAQDVPVTVPATSVPRDGLQLLNDSNTGGTVIEVTWHDGATDRTWKDQTGQAYILGARALKIETEATTEAAALEIGWAALNVSDPQAWQITGLQLSTIGSVAVSEATILALVDPIRRPGQRITITDCPAWVGGSTLDLLTLGATMTAEAGGWTISADVLNITH